MYNNSFKDLWLLSLTFDMTLGLLIKPMKVTSLYAGLNVVGTVLWKWYVEGKAIKWYWILKLKENPRYIFSDFVNTCRCIVQLCKDF